MTVLKLVIYMANSEDIEKAYAYLNEYVMFGNLLSDFMVLYVRKLTGIRSGGSLAYRDDHGHHHAMIGVYEEVEE